MAWLDELAYDDRGLVPVVAQEAESGEVLMLAWANREALELTAASGTAHYWSRSRGALWRKGESSGHVQEVVEVRADCDGDAVLYRVRQTGPACHTLASSCFHRAVEQDELRPAPQASHILSRVEEIVRLREAERPEGSYTTYLFDKGIDKVLKKMGEEATEVVIAAKNDRGDELTSEAADLLFHLVVLLRARQVPLDAVWRELERRFGSSSRIPAPRQDAHPHS